MAETTIQAGAEIAIRIDAVAEDIARYSKRGDDLVVSLKNGGSTGLQNPAQFVGFQGEAAEPKSVLLINNGLHIDIQINTSTPIGNSNARVGVGVGTSTQ